MHRSPRALALLATLLCLPGAAPALGLDWVAVGAPGNAADDTGFGAVAEPFFIARVEVSQAAYVEFLNAVAADDPAGLWDAQMATGPLGILRSGTAGTYHYSMQQPGLSGPLPVQHVSFHDALRFANWLHNGQPGGAQGPGTTEDGAYTLSPEALAEGPVARNPGATVFLPSEDQWYKAAYYDADADAWHDYPTGSDVAPLCTSLDLPNAGNCDDAVTAPSPVGSYAASPSPFGTLDQGGNVFEWTEGAIGGTRVVRGGSWFSDPADQAAGFRASSHPEQQTSNLGFRVAPEPGAAAGWIACAALLAGLARRRARSGAGALIVALCALGGADPARAVSCSDHFVPAALAEGQPRDQTIYAELCIPDVAVDADAIRTLLVFVHGITYTHDYWDVADPTGGSERYSFLRAAWARGFSTLGVDRLGAGQSSHPLSALVTIDSNAHTMHEVIQAARSWTVALPGSGSGSSSGGFGTGEFDLGSFERVVWVGHSYGSWTGWFEITRHADVDAAVFTGATHGLTQVDAPLNVAGNVYPAVLDPLFTESLLDPGYLTTRPDTRYVAFYAPGPVDPAVVAADEATKGTVTSAELQNYQLILAEPLDIRVPVFLTVGSNDTLFCGPALGGADCSSEEALIAFEAPFLGPNVPSVDAFVLPGGGHDMNPMWNAGLYFDAVLDWVETTVLP